MKLTFLYIILALTAVLTACGPASKLRRAEKLIQKAELQGATWKSDTVYHEVPIFIRQMHGDTTFVSQPGDTVTLI
ncbi:MAG TPA: hypothetical protein VK589_06065, partial [Chryseolinea sp.]|nr:hypothetical protein [Chryseolinea sp.]